MHDRAARAAGRSGAAGGTRRRDAPLRRRDGACACGGTCPHCASPDAKLGTDGTPAIANFRDAGDAVTIDAPRAAAGPASAPPAAPTDIRVVDIVPLPLRANNVAEGFRTGVGGIARMEVKDSSGRDWAGTEIHESIVSGSNTCQPGTDACPNAQGQGGASGSTFKVGAATSAFGASLPAQRNRFYDWHMAVTKPSLLHQQNLTTCEQKCTQRYSCRGQFFGPVFTIHRTMTRDQIMSGGAAVDVTRVHLEKPPDRGPPGDYPARPVLPPGEDVA